MRRCGFTLIELLIVVAIIAILAAIAVPNFLEAQMRAKISRCQADLRSIALGLESYRIDQGKYVPDEQFLEGKVKLSSNRETCRRHSMKLLTTPIAYLSSILFDPFMEKHPANEAGSLPDPRNVYVIRVMDTAMKNAPGGLWDDAYKLGYQYAIKSNGPARKAPGDMIAAVLVLPPGDRQEVYDPTNGTSSAGIILYTNQGLFQGSKR